MPPASERPVVSIVTALYQKAPYVAATARSILAQAASFPAFEWVVVDDGSTDGSADQLPDDPRIRVIRQENAGMPAAVNRGVAEARGDFVTFVDADDALLPGKLARQVRVLREHPEHDWLVSGFLRVDRHGARQPVLPLPDGPSGAVLPLHDAYAELAVKGLRMDALLLRRGRFERVGGLVAAATPFDHAHFFSRLLLECPRGVVDQQAVSVYDETVPGSLFKDTARRVDGCRAMAEFLFDLAERHPRHRERLRRQAGVSLCGHVRGIRRLGHRRDALRALLTYRGPHGWDYLRSVAWVAVPRRALRGARRARAAMLRAHGSAPARVAPRVVDPARA